GRPPRSFAAICCSFLIASLAVACAARVIACVVWLPPDTQLHGRFLDVSPQVMLTFSQGTPSISADTRWQSDHDSVPRLPMPVWMYIRPSGLMTKSPSKPTEPALYELIATPLPPPSEPCPRPLRALRSSPSRTS